MFKYTIYQITNKIHGRFYIGAHKTKDPYDDYMGSGVAIREAIKKYGRENFEKIVLHVFDTPEEMFEKECELVTEEVVLDPLCYNLTSGGLGGYQWSSIEKQSESTKLLWSIPEYREKVIEAIKKTFNDPEYLQKFSLRMKSFWQDDEFRRKVTSRINDPETLKKISEASKQAWQDPQYKKQQTERMKKRWEDEEFRESQSKIRKQKIWITNGSESKRINKGEEIPEGWRKGRIIKTMKREKKTCPHCGLTGAGPNMVRYHFDNCKDKTSNE